MRESETVILGVMWLTKLALQLKTSCRRFRGRFLFTKICTQCLWQRRGHCAWWKYKC